MSYFLLKRCTVETFESLQPMVKQYTYDELLLMYDQVVAERNEEISYKEKLEKRLEQSDKRIQELMEQLMLLLRQSSLGSLNVNSDP